MIERLISLLKIVKVFECIFAAYKHCTMQQAGKLFMLLGICIFLVGIVLWFGDKYFHWFGRLPGDIRVERENFKLYVPVTTMLIVSFLLSLLIWIVRKYMD
jgi:hypothetical protein